VPSRHWPLHTILLQQVQTSPLRVAWSTYCNQSVLHSTRTSSCSNNVGISSSLTLRSRQLISKLVLFSLNSGLWTAVVALATVITVGGVHFTLLSATFLSFHQLVAVPLPGLIFPALYTLLCPLYCNVSHIGLQRQTRCTSHVAIRLSWRT
jgi:hypothetical protein